MEQKQPRSKLTHTLIWLGGILGALIVVSAIYMFVMMSRMGAVPSDLDYSTTQASDGGLYNVSYTVPTGTIPINQIHQWTLHVERADGTPVENATIDVDGDMPQHGHGLPTKPRVTQNLGNGDYLVDGMKFQMGGWWLMDFTITSGGETDVVHFNMMLQ
ncbi:MAG: FixH family protein [Bacteroidota bacterium]